MWIKNRFLYRIGIMLCEFLLHVVEINFYNIVEFKNITKIKKIIVNPYIQL